MPRRRIVVALLALVLTVPSLAFAQGAGDEQYQDPFGEEQSQSEPTPTATPAPAAPAPSQAAPAPTATPGAAQAPAQAAPAPAGEELPRTGADAGALALAGAVLLLSGLALWRRADLQR